MSSDLPTFLSALERFSLLEHRQYLEVTQRLARRATSGSLCPAACRSNASAVAPRPANCVEACCRIRYDLCPSC